MLRHIDTQEPWDYTQPIDGVRYPRNIEKVWPTEELAFIGLEVAPVVPPVVEPPSTDPNDYPLSRPQFMWIIYDNDLEADIQTLINGLGAAAKAKAKAYLMDGLQFNHGDQHITALINQLGHTDAQWDTWWMLAKDE